MNFFKIYLLILFLQQRLSLVRLYALLSSLGAVLVVGTGLTRVVTHFIWKVFIRIFFPYWLRCC